MDDDKMRRWPRALTVLAFLFAPAVLWAAGKSPTSIVFQTSLGSVTFLHSNHGKYVKGNCAVCHHIKSEKKKQACRNCHKRKLETVEEDPISFYDVKMGLCRDCHREKRAANKASKAPVSCEECHNVKEIRYSN